MGRASPARWSAVCRPSGRPWGRLARPAALLLVLVPVLSLGACQRAQTPPPAAPGQPGLHADDRPGPVNHRTAASP